MSQRILSVWLLIIKMNEEASMKLPRLGKDYVNLYELIIFLCTLVANKFGLRGEIPIKGYQIANV